MTYVLYRYIFSIYILALIPLSFAFSCENRKAMKSITEDFKNIISPLIDDLNRSLSKLTEDTNCEDNHTYSCEEDNEIESIFQMICSMNIKNKLRDVKVKSIHLVQIVEQSLGCSCYRRKDHTGVQHGAEKLKRPHRREKRLCKIRRLLGNIQNCYTRLYVKYSSVDGT